MNIKPFLFSAIAVIGSTALIAHAAPAGEATDQVAASFDRLLNHVPTVGAAPVPPMLTADADPLRLSVSAVLWDRPSYHLPVTSAQLSTQSKSKH